MRNFRWTQENEIFLGQIDAEHRDLFRVAEGLQQALEEQAPAATVKQHLESLIAHTEEHFSHEEWLMQSVKYPSYNWHKQQHDTARRRLRLFSPLIQAGDAEAAELFLEFLSGWFQDHTSLTDRMMAAHIRNYERSHTAAGLERWGSRAAVAEPAVNEDGPFPKTMRFCKACLGETTHEIRSRGFVCLSCAERSVSADLDRD
ncbi:MAG: hypothetical protein C5B51_06240 [Terriglobia bacterium]|nr:MAG: hypothetical protein C5B51_06240 [Terriglobia bacterium]